GRQGRTGGRDLYEPTASRSTAKGTFQPWTIRARSSQTPLSGAWRRMGFRGRDARRTTRFGKLSPIKSNSSQAALACCLTAHSTRARASVSADSSTRATLRRDGCFAYPSVVSTSASPGVAWTMSSTVPGAPAAPYCTSCRASAWPPRRTITSISVTSPGITAVRSTASLRSRGRRSCDHNTRPPPNTARNTSRGASLRIASFWLLLSPRLHLRLQRRIPTGLELDGRIHLQRDAVEQLPDLPPQRLALEEPPDFLRHHPRHLAASLVRLG